MLRRKIEAINGYDGLTETEQQQLTRAVIRYLIFWKPNELKEAASEVCLSREIAGLKSSFLDSTTYASSKFWRALKMWLGGSPRSVVTSRYGVTPDTLSIVSNVLTAADVVEIEAELYKYAIREISDATRDKVLKKVRPLCRLLTHKMRFIARYDGGYDTKDFESDMMIEAIRVLSHYDYIENEAFLINIIKKSIRNYWSRLIDYHTAHKRKRLTNVGSSTTEYQVNILSLDYSSDEGEQSMHDIITYNSINTGRDVEEGDFISKLTREIPPRISQYVDIVLGRDFPTSFLHWVQTQYNRDAEELTGAKLASYAQDYLDITDEELQQLGMLVKEYGEAAG